MLILIRLVLTSCSFVVLASLIACGGSSNSSSSNNTAGDGSGSTSVSVTMILSSSNFMNGGEIPLVHACTRDSGSNASPQLTWSIALGDASNVQSYAIVMDDEVSPCGTGTAACSHWGLYNIPANTLSLEQNATISSPMTQSSVFDGSTGYAGPCPPSEHTYSITVYALSTDSITVATTTQMTRATFVTDFADNIIGSVTLTGIYDPPSGSGGFPGVF